MRRNVSTPPARPDGLAVALREVNRALELDPANADAPALRTAIEESIATRQEAARAKTAISHARGRFAKGEHRAALELLEDYPPPPNPEIAAALSELRAARAEIEEHRRVERERIERQQRIAALLAEARAALREERFEAAMSVLSKVEAIDPGVPDLLPLREQIRRDEAAARLNAELARRSASSMSGCRRTIWRRRRLAAGGHDPDPDRRACALGPPALDQAMPHAPPPKPAAAKPSNGSRRPRPTWRRAISPLRPPNCDRGRTGAAPPSRRGALQSARGGARTASRRRGGRTTPTAGQGTDSQCVATFPGHRRATGRISWWRYAK